MFSQWNLALTSFIYSLTDLQDFVCHVKPSAFIPPCIQCWMLGASNFLKFYMRCTLVLWKDGHLPAYHSSPQTHPCHFHGQEENSAPKAINLTQTRASSPFSRAEKGNADLRGSQGVHLSSPTLFMIFTLQFCRILSYRSRRECVDIEDRLARVSFSLASKKRHLKDFVWKQRARHQE